MPNDKPQHRSCPKIDLTHSSGKRYANPIFLKKPKKIGLWKSHQSTCALPKSVSAVLFCKPNIVVTCSLPIVHLENGKFFQMPGKNFRGRGSV